MFLSMGCLVSFQFQLCRVQEKISTIFMTSAAGALLIACGTDIALDRSLVLGVGHILQMT